MHWMGKLLASMALSTLSPRRRVEIISIQPELVFDENLLGMDAAVKVIVTLATDSCAVYSMVHSLTSGLRLLVVQVGTDRAC